MSIETLSYILTIAAALIVGLLAIVGFWLSRYVQSTDELKKVVIDLRLLVASIRSDQVSFKVAFDEFKKTAIDRLNSHSKRLDQQKESITRLQEKK